MLVPEPPTYSPRLNRAQPEYLEIWGLIDLYIITVLFMSKLTIPIHTYHEIKMNVIRDCCSTYSRSHQSTQLNQGRNCQSTKIYPLCSCYPRQIHEWHQAWLHLTTKKSMPVVHTMSHSRPVSPIKESCLTLYIPLKIKSKKLPSGMGGRSLGLTEDDLLKVTF